MASRISPPKAPLAPPSCVPGIQVGTPLTLVVAPYRARPRMCVERADVVFWAPRTVPTHGDDWAPGGGMCLQRARRKRDGLLHIPRDVSTRWHHEVADLKGGLLDSTQRVFYDFRAARILVPPEAISSTADILTQICWSRPFRLTHPCKSRFRAVRDYAFPYSHPRNLGFQRPFERWSRTLSLSHSRTSGFRGAARKVVRPVSPEAFSHLGAPSSLPTDLRWSTHVWPPASTVSSSGLSAHFFFPRQSAQVGCRCDGGWFRPRGYEADISPHQSGGLGGFA
eukprot:9487690-Pyramimonas_sp.AAC.3